MIENLNNFLKKYNYKAGIISFSRLRELKDEITCLYRDKYINENIYKLYLYNFSYNIDEENKYPFRPQSVIIVAVPRPQSRIYFNIKSKRFAVIVPPAYIGQRETNQKIEEILKCYFEGTGYNVLHTQTYIPEKLIAAHSGLTMYGKNNISYMDEFGSFFCLATFFSDIKCDYENWHEKKELEGCRECNICMENCPTGAITARHFLIQAENCLTFFNEKPGEFPEWVTPGAHNCLVGCMKCQIVCPHNRPFTKWIENAEEFTREETDIILNNAPVEKMPSAVIDKINCLGLEDYAGVLSRNIKALLEAEKY